MGACHGNLSGKGGFRLSLRGDDPDFDFHVADPRPARPSGRRLRPDRSLALLKPTGQVPTKGARFLADSDEARTLLRLDRRRCRR